jgi:beta-lactamase
MLQRVQSNRITRVIRISFKEHPDYNLDFFEKKSYALKVKKILLIWMLMCLCFSCKTPPNVTVTKINYADFYGLVQSHSASSTQLQNYDTTEEQSADEPAETGYVSVQLDAEIFEPKNEKYYDAILPNNMFSFLAYKNHCEIFFDASDITSFIFYINEIKVDSSEICSNGFSKIDASAIVKNGRNILYVSNIEKSSQSAALKIRIPYPILTRTNKKIPDVNYKALQLVDELLQSQVANGFPSVQILVAKDGFIVADHSYGKIYNVDKFSDSGLSDAANVTGKTLYDLASNTKMYATVFAIQRLVFEKKISIHDKISKFFPEFSDEKKARRTGKSEMTIEHLLTHSSGFPAGAAYYAKKIVKNANGKDRKEKVLKEILKTKLINNVGSKVVYSDINFMLLSFIVEKVTGQTFDSFVEDKIYTPLSLKRICFKPLEHGFPLSEIAATEIGLNRSKRNETNNYFVHGHVHDPEAYNSMNEVSGHAGLFGNAESLAVLAQTMINGGGYGNTRIFSETITRNFLGVSQYHPAYALGWRMQNTDAYKWNFSTLASPQTFGHTGWTGTMSLFDVENNLIIIILTNAKHSAYTGGNQFEGDYFLTKNYGAITSIIYSAFSDYDSEYLATLLTELASQKFALINTSPKFQNNGAYNDLAAIMQVLQKHSHSSTIKKFLKSETAMQINNLLRKNSK